MTDQTQDLFAPGPYRVDPIHIENGFNSKTGAPTRAAFVRITDASGKHLATLFASSNAIYGKELTDAELEARARLLAASWALQDVLRDLVLSPAVVAAMTFEQAVKARYALQDAGCAVDLATGADERGRDDA